MLKNGLIILDSGIDRKYDQISTIAKMEGFKMIIIRIKVNRKVAEKRATKRNGGKDVHFMKNISRWIFENEKFNNKAKAHAVINNNTKISSKNLSRKISPILGKNISQKQKV